jgi:hypothetical protein
MEKCQISVKNNNVTVVQPKEGTGIKGNRVYHHFTLTIMVVPDIQLDKRQQQKDRWEDFTWLHLSLSASIATYSLRLWDTTKVRKGNNDLVKLCNWREGYRANWKIIHMEDRQTKLSIA